MIYLCAPVGVCENVYMLAWRPEVKSRYLLRLSLSLDLEFTDLAGYPLSSRSVPHVPGVGDHLPSLYMSAGDPNSGTLAVWQALYH